MIRRLLILGVLLLAAWWWIRKMLRAARPAPGAAGTIDGPMVRDRECNTFLHREKALVLTDGDGEHYFCSEACRDAYRARIG